MRISDWSSDVCSSDLLLELALVGLDHAEVAAMAHLQLDVLADEAAQQVRQLGQDVGKVQQARLQGLLARKGKKLAHQVGGAVGVLLDLQIGIAACGERVCRYLYIWVVAVTVKKKKTTEK